MLVTSFFMFSCHGGSSDADRELERLSYLIGGLRDAPNAEKSAALARLQKSRCEHHCRLRTLCLQAYKRHQGALLHITEGQSRLQDPRGEQSARSSFQEAETELHLALEETRLCVTTEAELLRSAQP